MNADCTARAGRLTATMIAGLASAVILAQPRVAIAEDASAEPGDHATLLAAGDIARCYSGGVVERNLRRFTAVFGVDGADPGAALTAQFVEAHPDTPVLALGDLAYQEGSAEEFADCYDPYWGGFKDRTWPAPGNHEYRTPDAAGYYDYWGERAGPDRRGYYARRLNGWLVLSLNSEAAAGAGAAQADWLEAELTKSDAACVLAFFHKPAFSTKPRRDSENARRLFAILYRHGATLVLNGHNHFYERTRPLDANGEVDPRAGVVTFVVGTGGTPLDAPREPAAFSERLLTGARGLLQLDLFEGEYGWRFRSAKTGEALDAGSGACNARG